MAISGVEYRPLARCVSFEADSLIVDLTDGGRLSVPLAWFPTLSSATSSQLKDWEILGDGEGVHWPQLDEDLSVKGLFLLQP